MSKKSIAIAAYTTLSGSATFNTLGRKDVVKHLAGAVGISEACASTYLSNIRTGRWNTEPTAAVAKVAKVKTVKAKKAEATALNVDDVTKMSNTELVAVYNAKAAKPVNKFRDHATAVKRTLAAYGLNGA